jgi:ABC-2 type transport system ATP-binding protein
MEARAAITLGRDPATAAPRTGSAVSARNLSVTFPGKPAPVEALRGVDLEIPSGSLFVLLGANGAGKTTLMRCITGLVHPARGSLEVLGARPPDGLNGDRRALGRIGVLIENPGTYGRLNVGEYLSFFGSFYGVADLDARIRALCAQFGLEAGGKRVGKLSQGNRQKLQLIRSLLHDPELLLWDEPTDHLDPEAQREVLGYLRGYLGRTGATALVATHRLEQMENVASHFGFLRRGRVVKAGTREAILEAAGGGARIRFARELRAGELDFLGGEYRVAMGGDAVDITGAALPGALPALIKALVLRDLPVAWVEPLRAGLGETYAALMAGD